MRIKSATQEELLPEILYVIGAGISDKMGNRKKIPYVLKRINFYNKGTQDYHNINALLKLCNSNANFDDESQIGDYVLITFHKDPFTCASGILSSGLNAYNELNKHFCNRKESALYQITAINYQNPNLNNINQKRKNTLDKRKQKLKQNRIVVNVFGKSNIIIDKNWLYTQIKEELNDLNVDWKSVNYAHLR